MWPVLFNGMAVGFALQLCHRLHQDRLNHRPVYTGPCVTWLPPAITLANTGAIIMELCEPNPDWLTVGLDLLAAAGMLLICIRLWQYRRRNHTPHTTDPNDIRQTTTGTEQPPSGITAPPRYRP